MNSYCSLWFPGAFSLKYYCQNALNNGLNFTGELAIELIIKTMVMLRMMNLGIRLVLYTLFGSKFFHYSFFSFQGWLLCSSENDKIFHVILAVVRKNLQEIGQHH